MDNAQYSAITKFSKQQFVSTSTDNDLPALTIERRYLIAMPHSKNNIEPYQNFYQQLSIYHQKIAMSVAKQYVESLMSRKLIYLVVDPKARVKNGVNGTVMINNSAVAGVLLDITECEIDGETGDIGEIDTAYYGVYFNFIRAVTIINGRQLLHDKDIHQYLINFLFYFFGRSFKSKTYFPQENKDALKVCVAYFFYRFICYRSHQQCFEYLENLSEFIENKDLFKPRLDRLKKYKSMKDIFNAFVDFNLVDGSTPGQLMMNLLQSYYTPLVFYSVTTTLDYLMALVIVSKYNPYFLRGVVADTKNQDYLEKVFNERYMKHTKFDVNFMKKAF